MKKAVYTILAALALVACDRHVEFTNLPFVYFDNASLSLYEDAGVVEIPVYAEGATEDFTLTFATIDGFKKDAATGLDVPNGAKGTDYDIVDNDAAVLRFPAGTTSQVIKVSIQDFPGVLTGNKDFTLKIKNAGTSVSIGGSGSLKVTIIDNDHPLKAVLGPYTAKGSSLFSGEALEWTMTLVSDPDDYFKVWIDGILADFAGDYLSGADGSNHAVYATFSKEDDVTANLDTFTIPGGQKFADQVSGYDTFIYYVSGSSYSTSTNIVFTKNADGTAYEAGSGWGASAGGGSSFFEIIGNSPVPTLTKK